MEEKDYMDVLEFLSKEGKETASYIAEGYVIKGYLLIATSIILFAIICGLGFVIRWGLKENNRGYDQDTCVLLAAFLILIITIIMICCLFDGAYTLLAPQTAMFYDIVASRK